MDRRLIAVVIMVPLLVALLGPPPVRAEGTISGSWVVTQAAQQSHGSSPRVVACGTFTIAILSSAGTPTKGIYLGLISFHPTYVNPAVSPPALPGGIVQGAYMMQTLGAVFVNFRGSDIVPAFGSLVSPAPQPHPSINPTSVGCDALGNGFLGLLHLPGQGTEGATMYSDSPIDPSVFHS